MRSVSFRRLSGVLSSASWFGMTLPRPKGSPGRCSCAGILFSQLELLSDSLTLLDTFRFRDPITVLEASGSSVPTRSPVPLLTLTLLPLFLPLDLLPLLLSLLLLLLLPLLRTITSPSCRFLLLNNLSLVLSSQLVTFDRITSSSSSPSPSSSMSRLRLRVARPIRSNSAACLCRATSSSACMIRVCSFCFRRLPRLEPSLPPLLPQTPPPLVVSVSALSSVVIVDFVGVWGLSCSISSGSVEGFSVVVVVVIIDVAVATETSCMPSRRCFRRVTRGLMCSVMERRMERRLRDDGGRSGTSVGGSCRCSSCGGW